MRQARWSTLLAVAMAAAACGNGADEAAETERPDVDVASMAEPACEPSEDMDVAGRPSPYDSASVEVGEGVAKICYGRPFLKGRTMIGGQAVPYDTLWRTGANEPTTLHVTVPASVGGVPVEPGSYSLYTVPREAGEWTLIVNRSTEQWGHESSYTDAVRAQEVDRVEVRAETLEEEVDQLTIRPMEAGGGVLLEWQNSRVHIPITPAG